MRVIVALTGLVFAATVVVGQDAVQPSPQPVNPICDIAFSRVDRQAASSPGPTDAAASPAPSANPEAVLEGTFLDDAIRMCSGVEDFVGGASLHPEVLGEIDPLVFLAARCTDPMADLGRYATCGSLERALATPTPTLDPTPSPGPTPKPTRTPKPAKKPKQTPRPTARPTARSAAKPGIKMTGVPSRYRAPVPGASRVHYFAVKGKTPKQLIRSVGRQASKYCGAHAAACMETRGAKRVKATYVQDPSTGSCTITSVKMPLTYVAHMPRWTAPSRVPAYMAWWWKQNTARIGWHEAQHVKIAKRYEAKLPKMVVGKPCSKYSRITKRWFKSLVAAQNAFDRLDYPRGDRASDRWWRRAHERFLR